MLVGTVRELWRYPVKSLRGERIAQAHVVRIYGIPGDRSWGVRDDTVGEIRSAKKLSALLQSSARCIGDPRNDDIPAVQVTLPDGSTFRADDPALGPALSAVVGRPVSVLARRPADDTEFYKRRTKLDEIEVRAQYGLEPGESLPDMSATPAEMKAELTTYVSPRGTLFDAFELHLLTTSSIAAVGRRNTDAVLDVRRFRPNLLVEPIDASVERPEIDWCGQRLRIGGALVEVQRPMQRCAMTTHAQGELPTARSLMRTLVRDFAMDLGVGMRILEPGTIREGDDVALV